MYVESSTNVGASADLLSGSGHGRYGYAASVRSLHVSSQYTMISQSESPDQPRVRTFLNIHVNSYSFLKDGVAAR